MKHCDRFGLHVDDDYARKQLHIAQRREKVGLPKKERGIDRNVTSNRKPFDRRHSFALLRFVVAGSVDSIEIKDRECTADDRDCSLGGQRQRRLGTDSVGVCLHDVLEGRARRRKFRLEPLEKLLDQVASRKHQLILRWHDTFVAEPTGVPRL